jgi:hypothetical protein
MSPHMPTYEQFRCTPAFIFDRPSEFTYDPVCIYAHMRISERVRVRVRLDLSKIEVVA